MGTLTLHTLAMPQSCHDALNAPFARKDSRPRGCDHAGCGEAGLYRAPAGREREGQFYWFCLEHVRAYNQAWDYFSGMSEADIDELRRRDSTWQRPTWRLGQGPSAAYAQAAESADSAFAGFSGMQGQYASPRPPKRPRTEEERALAELELPATAAFAEIRSRYRELAKRLHPDANGGANRQAEERLKRVTRAYATLKALRA